MPPGLTATGLLPYAERHQVSFIPGARFSSDGDDGFVRLAFSLYGEAELAEGARRLAAAIAAALAAGR